MRQKRVLVTGGAGFLGSHLCDRLVKQCDDVICLDNFFTGSKKNIYHLLDKPNFELIRHDVTFPIYLEVDEIYNLACPASPVYYQRSEDDNVYTFWITKDGKLMVTKLFDDEDDPHKRSGTYESTKQFYGWFSTTPMIRNLTDNADDENNDPYETGDDELVIANSRGRLYGIAIPALINHESISNIDNRWSWQSTIYPNEVLATPLTSCLIPSMLIALSV